MRRISALMLALGILAVAALTLRATAQDAPGGPPAQGGGGGDGGAGGGGPPKGAPGFHLLPRFVMEKLNLTADQATKVAALEKETKTKLDAILTADQQKILSEMRPPRGQGGPGGQSGQGSGRRSHGGQGGGGGQGGPGGGGGGGEGGGPPPQQ